MSIAVENLPIIFLIIVGIGMMIVLVGILRLANEQDHGSVYTKLEENGHTSHLEDLFSFFLQEEEKKNQDFREMVMSVTKDKEERMLTDTNQNAEFFKSNKKMSSLIGQGIYKEIIKRYEDGQDVETIAKDLKKGTGEVKLIISLYARR